MALPTKEQRIYIAKGIGRRMLMAREAAGLSQTDAANHLGYSNSSKLSKVEKGGNSCEVPCWLMVSASKLYSVPIGELFPCGSAAVGKNSDTRLSLIEEMHASDTARINSLLHELENDRSDLRASIAHLSREMDRFELFNPFILGVGELANAVLSVTTAFKDHMDVKRLSRVFPEDVERQVRVFQ